MMSFPDSIGQLDGALVIAEEMLRGLKLGVSAEVLLGDEFAGAYLAWAPTEPHHGRTLHILRADGVRTDRFGGCSITVREAAAAAIPTLVDVMQNTREVRAREIGKAADALLTYIETIMDDAAS